MSDAFDIPLIRTTSSISEDGIPKQILDLADTLSRIHGEVVVTKESRGIHLYMACPHCLETEGARELDARHLAVNAERFFGLGPFAALAGTYNIDRSALCMKETKPINVCDLLNMLPLEQRGIKASRERQVHVVSKEHRLVDDGRGNRIPEDPGTVIPINQLPDDHPAVVFVRSRGYEPEALYNHLQVSYCESEMPEDRSIGRVYRRLPGGFFAIPGDR
jgi:hypothetical protein